jgi:hypothetical protein
MGIVPKALQGEYGDPLRKVQQIATAFTLLENPSSRLMLSDLNTFLSCARIVSHLDNRADTLEVDQISYHLEVAKRRYVKILDCVLGFTFTLEGARTMATSSYNNFSKFKSWWRLNRLTWRSRKTSDEFASWVESEVGTSRKTQTFRTSKPALFAL